MLNSYLKCPQLLSESTKIDTDKLDKFLSYLETNGYTYQTIQHYLAAIVHFNSWRRNHHYSDNKAEKHLYLNEHLPICQCPRSFIKDKNLNSASISHWFRINSPDYCDINHTWNEELVAEFDQYLQEVAGLSLATRLYRCRYAHEFLLWTLKSKIDLPLLNYQQIVLYFQNRAEKLSLSSMSALIGSLNSFIRFLSAKSLCSLSPDFAFPHPKLQYNFPEHKALSNHEVNLLFQGLDQNTPVGKRDYAILRCLVDLGIRTNEVSRIQFRDIDWRQNTLLINASKVKEQSLLPLSLTLKTALVEYILNARPKSDSQFVFVYHKAPVGQAIKSTTVRGVVRRLFKKAGFAPEHSQVHRLRHTIASQLVHKKVPLKVISDVLGHQCIDTTIKYITVYQQDLLQIALPWPGRND